MKTAARLAHVALSAIWFVAVASCGGDDGGKSGRTTLPTAAQVSAAAKKPADHEAINITIVRAVAGACTAEDVGLCGCLPEAAWYTDGTNVYDVVCCEEVGDNFNLHACGADRDCDESGAVVECTGG